MICVSAACTLCAVNPEGHLAFAVQNASDEPIHLDLERLRPPLMGFALGLFREQDGLRLFVSDDSEFTARPGHPDRIRFLFAPKPCRPSFW